MPRGHQQKPPRALALRSPQPGVLMSPEPHVWWHPTAWDPSDDYHHLLANEIPHLPAWGSQMPVQLCSFPFSLLSPRCPQGHQQQGRTDTSHRWIPLGWPHGTCSLLAPADNIFCPPGENQHPPGSPGAASMGNFRAGSRKKKIAATATFLLLLSSLYQMFLDELSHGCWLPAAGLRFDVAPRDAIK